MSVRDYADYKGTFIKLFPPQPRVKKDECCITVAVIVELPSKPFPHDTGHSAIAISKPGVGFDPPNMEFYDFGPAGDKSQFMNLKPVAGGPWRDKMMQDKFGKPISNANFFHFLGDIDRLTEGKKTYIYVVQVNYNEGKEIEKYWRETVYNTGKDGKRGKMPTYSFIGSGKSLQCTTCVANSLRRAGSKVFDLPISKAEEMLKWSKIRPADFRKVLEGEGWLGFQALNKLRRLTNTCGPQKGKQAEFQIRKGKSWSVKPNK